LPADFLERFPADVSVIVIHGNEWLHNLPLFANHFADFFQDLNSLQALMNVIGLDYLRVFWLYRQSFDHLVDVNFEVIYLFFPIVHPLFILLTR
jgi:hypothetical protein